MNQGTYISIRCDSNHVLLNLQEKLNLEFELCGMAKHGKTLLIPVPDCGYRFSLKQLRRAVAPAKVKMFDYEVVNGKKQRIYYDFSA